MSITGQHEMEHQPSDHHLWGEPLLPFPRSQWGSGGDDEGLHTPGSAQNWRESYYFGFFGEEGQTGIGYISLSPNQRTVVRMILIMMPKGEKTLVYLQEEPLSAYDGVVLENGDLQFRCLAPLQLWRLQAEAVCLVVPSSGEITSALMAAREDPSGVQRVPIAFDLCFEARMPPYRYPDGALDFLGQAQQHFEQMGKVSGRLRIDGEEAPIEASASRDRSWGIRDWLRPEWYKWVHLGFEGDTYIGAVFGRSRGRETSSGFVYQDGRFHPIARVVMDTHHDPESLHLLSGRAQIVTETRKEVDVVLEPRSFSHFILARAGATQCHDSVTTVICKCDGQIGKGVLDHEHREVLSRSSPEKAGVW